MYSQLSTILAASTLLVGIASAQTAATLPSCANNCVTSLLPASCNLDPNCICHTSSFLDNIGCCVFKACDAADQTAALAYAHSICDPVSASSLLPASATCTSSASSGSSTSSGTATGAAASASSSASAKASSASSAASSRASGASASASSAASSITAAASSAASSASSAASSAASAGSASAASATASPTGAANQVAVGLGAMGAGMLGLAALL